MAELSEVWDDDYDSEDEQENINNFYNLSNQTTAAAIAAKQRNKRLSSGLRNIPRSSARDKRSVETGYAPVNYVSDTSKHSPMFYNDHTHVNRILTHMHECKECKLSIIRMLREGVVDPIPSLSSKDTMEHFGNANRGGILSRIIGDAQLLIIIILLLIFYIIQNKR